MAIATFDNRKVYFDNCGVEVKDATSMEQAIQLAKLDYEVEKKPLYLQSPLRIVKDHFATVRTDTKEPLGIVGNNYTILQNHEAFGFLDSLFNEGAKFETAGEYRNGGASFITCSTEPINILGDAITPYILFMNSFDGSGAVRGMFTPVRVFCSNCIMRATKQSINKFSIRHTSQIESKLEQAKQILLANTQYMESLKEEAKILSTTPLSEDQFIKIASSIDEFAPASEGDPAIISARQIKRLEALLNAYRSDDLENFKNTAYKAVQATADYESHKPDFHKVRDPYKNFQSVVAMMPIMNTMTDRILASV